MDIKQPIVIIGAGGAGLMAAISATALSAPVLILERNRKAGIKLLISGGGKCNITHAGLPQDILNEFPSREARFLKPSMYRFTNDHVIRLLEGQGIETYTRPNGRVFPVSGRAADVVNGLISRIQPSFGVIQLNTRVTGITHSDRVVTGVRVGSTHIPARQVILSTGGASYPRTGTTGDGFRWASNLGHSLVPVQAALAPIAVVPPLPRDWQGVAVREGSLSVYSKSGKLISWNDDILFTHEGISGPAALEVSRTAAANMNNGDVWLELDFFPQQEFVAIEEELIGLSKSHPHRTITSILEPRLPNRIVPGLLKSAGVDPETRGRELTRVHRRTIVSLLKGWKIGNVKTIDYERGEVTAGGISLDEVSPKTMESRIVRGLFVCGEVLDIAGPVGGYNLQAAFSTGYVAGESAALAWHATGSRSSVLESSG